MGIPVNTVPMGFTQATAAMQATLASALGRRAGGAPRRRRSKARKVSMRSSRTRKRARAAGRKRAHLVKGSAAAKRYMAKLRKMSRRRRA